MKKHKTSTEILAMAWLMCDPNRQPAAPEDPIDNPNGTMNGLPYWNWFVPRAEEIKKFLLENGYSVAPTNIVNPSLKILRDVVIEMETTGKDYLTVMTEG